MSTYRISKRENPFVQIDKTMIHDTRLSWKAKGILMYLLSRPDDWKVYEIEVIKHSKDGRESTRSGIKELIECGYIIRKQLRGEKGKYLGYEYLVFETPHHEGLAENGFSDNGKVDTTNKDITNKDSTNKKIYLIKDNEAPVFSYYSSIYEEYFGQVHPPMNKEKNERLINAYDEFTTELDISEETWMDLVDHHFDNLPEGNNGNMLGFLNGCIHRYIDEI